MVEKKDRRTNMVNSSVHAPPAKDGAGGSYVWGSPTSVTDFTPAGTSHVNLQMKQGDLVPNMPIQQDSYINDLQEFPALGGPPRAAKPSEKRQALLLWEQTL